ncbi:MAG: RluA family pseudouridine synthase [Betaproteobacteria bacterium]|nr:MAG: RluA family pseudouridine synthase [Betaproteobacteria bacterium]
MKGLRKDSATWLDADEASAGQRIDNMLCRVLKGVPRQHIYRLLRTGQVRVNSGRVEATYRVQANDRIRIPPVRTARREQPPSGLRSERLESQILFEDDVLLVIDKPAGMAVHGGSGVSRGVIEEMRHSRPRLRFLELVHRLDRDTSGVLLLAKKRSALVALHAAMRDGAVTKCYTLLVLGRAPLRRQELAAPLEKYLLPGGDRRVKVAAGGQSSRTIFEGIRHIGAYTLLQAELLTGRTHQIRVHSAHLGHPIAGDDKYGDFAANRVLAKQGLKRMFLHASRVRVTHPTTAQPIELAAPLPDDLVRFLAGLEADADRRS